ncbi:HPP family protein [Magnetofaba australis]|nr:CBS domain-containing protein [Magnetofaba australis]
MSAESENGLLPEDFRHALESHPLFSENLVSPSDLYAMYKEAQRHALLRRMENVRAADIMTRDVITFSETNRLVDVAQTFLTRHAHNFPVIDAAGCVVGVIAVADLLQVFGVPHHHPRVSLWESLIAHFRWQPGSADLHDPVSTLMSRNVVSIGADARIGDVLERMREREVKRLLVVDEQERLQGVISPSDMIRTLLQGALAQHERAE